MISRPGKSGAPVEERGGGEWGVAEEKKVSSGVTATLGAVGRRTGQELRGGGLVASNDAAIHDGHLALAMGLAGFEPATSRLSSVRSNQLSYKPERREYTRGGGGGKERWKADGSTNGRVDTPSAYSKPPWTAVTTLPSL
jgi:hypothetical protein